MLAILIGISAFGTVIFVMRMGILQMNDDAFSQIIIIINAIKQKLFEFDSENEVLIISKDFEKYVINSLLKREEDLSKNSALMDMVGFRVSKPNIPCTLHGYKLMGIKIEVCGD